MKLTAQLISVAEAYCQATGLSLSRVSTLIFNDGKRLGSIKEGANLYTNKFEDALDWFSNHWPEGDETWPLGVPRPAKAKAPEAVEQ